MSHLLAESLYVLINISLLLLPSDNFKNKNIIIMCSSDVPCEYRGDKITILMCGVYSPVFNASPLVVTKIQCLSKWISSDQ